MGLEVAEHLRHLGGENRRGDLPERQCVSLSIQRVDDVDKAHEIADEG